MRTIHILGILVLLAVAAPAAPAQAGGVVTVCDEAHLRAALVGGGTVTFTCSGTITLTNTIKITADTSIDGSGQEVTISGNNAVRVFTVNPGAALSLNGLTVVRGRANQGGGISNGGTLVVSNSTFSDHFSFRGGGISSDGTLTVSDSTFTGNSAMGSGGGILNFGALMVSSSTFSNNSAGFYEGGGGSIFNYSQLIVSDSTFTGNTAADGGGIMNGDGTATVRNSAFHGINADPLLGPLQNNGGPTETMALGEGSAAIDAADDTICAAPPVNSLDQRGVTRPQGTHCDIGALEQIQEPSAVSVSALRAQSLPGTITPIMIAGLLLVLVAVGVQRRPCHIG